MSNNKNRRVEVAKYKVVPAEITDEMAEASGCEGCFRKSAHDQAQDMWTAMLTAAPDAQGKPVAYAVFTDDGNIRIWCADPIQTETLRQQYGGALQPLYTATKPAPDVSGLVAIAREIADLHAKRKVVLTVHVEALEDALAAYRKGAES